jgi:hypothetical protein
MKERIYMPYPRFACVLVVLILGFTIVADAQVEKAFPTDEEIDLLLAQADRTMQRYKPLLDEQEAEIGKSVAAEIAKDRQLAGTLELVLKSLKTQHSRFNGLQGFTFLESLHDIERNLLRCVNTASSGSTGYMIAGNRDKAAALLALSEHCQDLSLLVYTISESAVSLYQHFIEAEDQWAAHSSQEARQCETALEKIRPRKLDPAY